MLNISFRISLWLKASHDHAESIGCCPVAIERSLLSTGHAFKSAIVREGSLTLDSKVISPEIVFSSHKVDGPKKDRRKIIV